MTLNFFDLIAIVGAFVASFVIIILIMNVIDYRRNIKIESENKAAELQREKLRSEISKTLSELIPSINQLTEELKHTRLDQVHLSDIAELGNLDYKISKIAKGYSESGGFEIEDAFDSVSSLEVLIARNKIKTAPLDESVYDNHCENLHDEILESVEIEITQKTDPCLFSSDSMLAMVNFRLVNKPVGTISFKAMSDAVNRWNSDAMLTVFEYSGNDSIGTIRFIIDTAPEEGEEITLRVRTTI